MSLPTIQPPPTTDPHSTLQPEMTSVAAGEVKVTGPGHNLKEGPGYATRVGEDAFRHDLRPENYAYGFIKDGRYIGVNPYHPHPQEGNLVLGDVPLNVDWSRHQDNNQTFTSLDEDKECRGDVAEYFTAENDEGYNQWLARKEKEKLLLEKKQKEILTVPQEIKDLPGHQGPGRTETTYEDYGRFNDLLPRPPCVYPLPTKLPPTPMRVVVNFRKSNMSDHPPIPDHPFAVDPRELITREGCYQVGFNGAVHFPEIPGKQAKTPFTYQTARYNLGEKVGERQTGYTFPVLAPTGLEINRPIQNRCVSVLQTTHAGQTRPNQLYVPANSVPRIYSRYMSYSSYTGGDPETEPNPARKPVKVVCTPFTPYPPPQPKINPCHPNYHGASLLPVPVSVRQPPC